MTYTSLCRLLKIKYSDKYFQNKLSASYQEEKRFNLGLTSVKVIIKTFQMLLY